MTKTKGTLDTFIEGVLKEPPKDITELLPGIPNDWKWVRLKNVLLDLQPGFACGSKSRTRGFPHLRMNNIDTSGRIDLSLLWYAPIEKDKIEKYLLKKGDVLFNNTNSPELVGKTAVFNIEGDEYVFSNHLTRLRPDRSKLIPEWLACYLRFLWHKRYFERNCTRWVNQAAFNRKKLIKLAILLPPLSEQKRIVARIGEMTSRIEQAKKLHEETGKVLEKIMPAVLDKGFRGEL